MPVNTVVPCESSSQVKYWESTSVTFKEQLRQLIFFFLLKSKVVILQRWQAMYTLVIDVGEKLRTVSDPETSTALQEELSQLQQCWGKTQALLEKKKMQFSGTLQVDDALPTCCSGIGSQELPCPIISRAELLLAAGAL